jgi:hypothetical protein
MSKRATARIGGLDMGRLEGHTLAFVGAAGNRTAYGRASFLALAIALAAVACVAEPEILTLPPLHRARDTDSGVRHHVDAGAPTPDAAEPGCTDRDDDGFCAEDDCDDENVVIHPGAPEACNGLDDDCDRDVDEDLGQSACGAGACLRVVPHCAMGRPTACTPAPPAPETCNGSDDDCDGQTDEGLSGQPCGAGACQRNSACENGQWAACVPGAPSPEVCNGADDDCNGTNDDGFRAEYVIGSYTELAAHHGDCNAGARIGPACNAAMHRFCASRPCKTSGFGPLENSGDRADVGCVSADPPRQTTYTVLASHHDVCDGGRERMGPNCNAAIHRFCASQGYASGFGPNENSGDAAAVTCVRPEAAQVHVTSYTELATHHDVCDGSRERVGPNCNAAINRWCGSRGFTTGFGPVENSGDIAVVTCVRP